MMRGDCPRDLVLSFRTLSTAAAACENTNMSRARIGRPVTNDCFFIYFAPYKALRHPCPSEATCFDFNMSRIRKSLEENKDLIRQTFSLSVGP
jgi:hypothetical protein